MERIYLPRSAGGEGLINVENLYYRRAVSIACHLSTFADSLVGMCLKLDELLPAQSALTSMAASYCASLLVPCDLWQCNALSLKREICKKQKDLLMSALLAKPLHRQYFSFVYSDLVDKQSSFNWLRQHLHSEIESTILAVQD